MAWLENTTAVIGVVIPMLTIAGSAVVFCYRAYIESQDRRRNALFELFKLLDSNSALAVKLGAAYQLRFFPEHDDFIRRICSAIAVNIEGSAANEVQRELLATINFIDASRPKIHRETR